MINCMAKAACISILAATPTFADVYSPQPGTPVRSAILDSVRIIAAYDLGGPIEFVVTSLEIDGDVGLFRGAAQRPGGQQIEITQTPMVTRDDIPVDFIDGPTVEAFVKRLDGHWYIDAYAVGATDVWWIGPPYCADYSTLLPTGAC